MQGLQFNTKKTTKVVFKNRLRREDGFSHVLSAKKIEDEQLKVFFVSNPAEGARLGIVVRKKTFPTSVERNRIKRIVREIFRKHTIRSKQLDLVVLAKAVSFTNDQTSLTRRLHALFSKIETKCGDL